MRRTRPTGLASLIFAIRYTMDVGIDLAGAMEMGESQEETEQVIMDLLIFQAIIDEYISESNHYGTPMGLKDFLIYAHHAIDDAQKELDP
jgi:hypothetical protein